MTNDVLLIFLKNPNVLTKLSQSLGKEKAQEINEKLQTVTCSVAGKIDCKKIVFYPYENFIDSIWNTGNFNTDIQKGIHLNEKIKNAFNSYILQNKEDIAKVILINEDCPQLTQTILEKAFESLNKYDVCIGPEKKGGYYLIGMKEPLTFLFENKIWSTNQLLDETLEELIDHGKNYFLLPELQCVTDIYDLHLLK